MSYCECCGIKSDWLSMRGLCLKCCKVPGALKRRMYDWQTGRKKVQKYVA